MNITNEQLNGIYQTIHEFLQTDSQADLAIV